MIKGLHPSTKTYHGRACKTCRGTLRFVSTYGCVSCGHKISRRNRVKSPAVLKKCHLRQVSTVVGRTRMLLGTARQREGKRGVQIEHRLETDRWVGPIAWQIAYGPFSLLFLGNIHSSIPQKGKRGRRADDFSPSLDRWDRTIPTYANNFTVVPWVYNKWGHRQKPEWLLEFIEKTGLDYPTEALRLV